MPQLPENPPTFAPAPRPDLTWHWRLESADGNVLDSIPSEVEDDGELAGKRFASQGDAESWLGEFFHELAEAGVDQVTLLEVDRVVYGPMSLHPA